MCAVSSCESRFVLISMNFTLCLSLDIIIVIGNTDKMADQKHKNINFSFRLARRTVLHATNQTKQQSPRQVIRGRKERLLFLCNSRF